MIAKEKLNILWSLEQTAEKYADRVAVSDVNQELTTTIAYFRPLSQ